MNRIRDELTSERALKKFLRESDFAFLEMLSARISAALDENAQSISSRKSYADSGKKSAMNCWR